MAGSKAGSKLMMETMRNKYGDEGVSEFFRAIGKKGGSKRVTKGFGKMDKQKVREAGRRGGTISRRGPTPYKNHTGSIDGINVTPVDTLAQEIAEARENEGTVSKTSKWHFWGKHV